MSDKKTPPTFDYPQNQPKPAPAAEVKPGGTAKAKTARRMPSWLQTLSSIERRLSAMTPEMARQSLVLLGGQYGLTLVPTAEAKT